ncbi:hypothetical protein HPB52_021552 [Rhipicephalus sanguineus]|uniref:Uncharacterized protein n=1 Tax=Rhipicephalus sanguineus TaxID=34632 RepID=A0A9D4SP77_RHISA|nr:hypothetical protein HPB52_021552 [Rhipicephalus sanguineus]
MSELNQRSCVGSDATVFDTTPVTVSPASLIEEVFEIANSVPLPTRAWACHKVDVDGLRTITFCEVFMISEAATHPDGSAICANYSYYGAAPSRVIMKRVTLKTGQQKPWTVAQKPENKHKNRYADLLPCE